MVKEINGIGLKTRVKHEKRGFRNAQGRWWNSTPSSLHQPVTNDLACSDILVLNVTERAACTLARGTVLITATRFPEHPKLLRLHRVDRFQKTGRNLSQSRRDGSV